MTDRVCIHSKGAEKPHISADDLLSCCGFFTCGMGCNGGYPSGAWSYFKSHGIVTGGQYNSSKGCRPYEVASCDHHVKGKRQPCGPDVETPRCKRKCIEGRLTSFLIWIKLGAIIILLLGVWCHGSDDWPCMHSLQRSGKTSHFSGWLALLLWRVWIRVWWWLSSECLAILWRYWYCNRWPVQFESRMQTIWSSVMWPPCERPQTTLWSRCWNATM